MDPAIVENSVPKQRGKPFQKGVSGNPAGKPRGARNKLTVFAEKLTESDVTAIVKVVNDAALAGDLTAAGMVLARVWPVPKGRRVTFDWPHGLDVAGIGVAFDAILTGIGAGNITVDEGNQIAGILERKAAIMETHDLQKEIAELREMIAKLQEQK
jgi:hypothetical protein